MEAIKIESMKAGVMPQTSQSIPSFGAQTSHPLPPSFVSQTSNITASFGAQTSHPLPPSFVSQTSHPVPPSFTSLNKIIEMETEDIDDEELKRDLELLGCK